MQNKKIVFLLGSTTAVYSHKRINGFISKGFDIEIYGIERINDNLNTGIDGKKIHVIGKQEDGKRYIKKFFQNQAAIKKIIKNHDPDKTIFYSFGFALTLSLKLNKGKNYIYEIFDILYGYNKFNSVRWIFKALDKYLIKNSLLTVLTSEGFGNFLFGQKCPNNIIIQPNRLHPIFLNKQRLKVEQSNNTIEHLIFSYVGFFRYPNTVFRFARIIGKKYPQHEFHFYGDSDLTSEVIKLSETYNNIKYFGSFKNPDDLPNIYSNIDIVIACYDARSLNEKIAEPNKLYEALYFNKPIVVSKNTFLAEKVKTLGCGFEIDASKDESIISFINSLTEDKLNKIYANIQKVELEEMIDDNSKKIIHYIEENCKWI
jgi:succinoglycan biosynthesis protein ExoL